MTFRTIDARGIWRREPKALDVFTEAFAVDCNGQDETFLRVYGWSQESLDATLIFLGDTSREPFDPSRCAA